MYNHQRPNNKNIRFSRQDPNPFTISQKGAEAIAVHRGTFYDMHNKKRLHPRVNDCNLKHIWKDTDHELLVVNEFRNKVFFKIQHDDRTLYDENIYVTINRVDIESSNAIPDDDNTNTYIELATLNFIKINNEYSQIKPRYNLNSDLYHFILGSPSSSSSSSSEAGCVKIIGDIFLDFDEDNCLTVTTDKYKLCAEPTLSDSVEFTYVYTLSDDDVACLENLANNE